MSTPTNGPGAEGYPHNPTNGGYPPQGYQPPKKKRKKWPWVLGILVLLGILLFGGCAALMGGAMNAAEEATNNSQSSDPAPAADESADGGNATANADVELAGTASGGASATYGPLGSASTADFDGSWSQTAPALDDDFYSLTVQDRSGADDATVSCSISEGGKVIEEQKATGAYSIATCTQPLF